MAANALANCPTVTNVDFKDSSLFTTLNSKNSDSYTALKYLIKKIKTNNF